MIFAGEGTDDGPQLFVGSLNPAQSPTEKVEVAAAIRTEFLGNLEACAIQTNAVLTADLRGDTMTAMRWFVGLICWLSLTTLTSRYYANS